MYFILSNIFISDKALSVICMYKEISTMWESEVMRLRLQQDEYWIISENRNKRNMKDNLQVLNVPGLCPQWVCLVWLVIKQANHENKQFHGNLRHFEMGAISHSW